MTPKIMLKCEKCNHPFQTEAKPPRDVTCVKCGGTNKVPKTIIKANYLPKFNPRRF